MKYFRKIALDNLPLSKKFSYEKEGIIYSPTFLYGAFQKGENNYTVLSGLGAELMGEAQLKGFQLWRTEVSVGNKFLPAIKKGRGTVYGGFYQIPHLKVFESYLGVPHFFRRKDMTIIFNGEKIEVGVYLYRGDDFISKIKTGNYRNDTE